MEKRLGFFVAATLTAFTIINSGLLSSGPTELLTQVTTAVGQLRENSDLQQVRKVVLRARAVFIVPSLVSAKFVVGASGGNGVLMIRRQKGWSSPIFYTIRADSLGLQAELQNATLVMYIMSDKALSAMQKKVFRLGASSGTRVRKLGESNTDTDYLKSDILFWTSAAPSSDPINLDGWMIKPRDEWTKTYYGRDVKADDIISGKVKDAAPDRLGHELATLNPL